MDAATKFKLVHVLTQYDRRQERRPDYNPYALGRYLLAANQVEEDVKLRGLTLRDAIIRQFTGRLVVAVLKGMGLEPPTLAEIRGTC